MEEIHGQNYPLHLEVIATFFSIVILGFGMYGVTYGQINPAKNSANINGGLVNDPNSINGTIFKDNIVNYGKYDPKTNTVNINGVNYPVSQVNNNIYTVIPGNGTNNAIGVSAKPINQNRGRTNTNTKNNTNNNNNNNNNSNTGFGERGFVDDIGYKSDGEYIPYNNNASYNQGGSLENLGSQTQGVNVDLLSSSSYGPNGLNEELAKQAIISKPTSSNVNFKNCSAFTKYHAFGDRGGDVGAIQMFLKEKGYYGGKVDGVYGITTFKAVQAFQKDYADQILNPWEIKNQKATGVWYKSTRKKANQLMGCPEPAVYLERVDKVLEY